MKKLTLSFAICALVFASNNAFAAKKSKIKAKEEAKFLIGVSVDQVNGTAFENTYSNDRKISELAWQVKDLHMATIHLEFPLYEGLRLRTSYGSAIDRGSSDATMVSSDWLGSGGSNDGNIDYNNWTHRSWSKAEIAEANNFDANLSYNFFYNFHFNVGFKRTYFEWKDFAGDFTHSDSSFRDNSGNFGGVSRVTYDQTMDIPYIGLEIQQPIFKKKLLLTLSGAYSNIVAASSFTQYNASNLQFHNDFDRGEYYNFGAKIDYFFNRDLSLGFGYEYNEVAEMRGDSFITNTATDANSSCRNCEGLSNKYEKFSISLKYLFGIPQSISSLFN